jgi:DNA-binding CsgD family transcriptional regulator
MERLREMARHNEAAALRHARDEGRAEGEARGQQEIINMLKSGKSPEEIIKRFSFK